MIPRPLWVANALGAVASAVASVIVLVNPGFLGDAGPGGAANAQLYAVRAIPLAAVVLVILARQAPQGRRGQTRRGLVPVLAVAGLAQLGDALIGVGLRIPGMAIASTVLAAVHLGTVVLLVRRNQVPVNQA
jgi:hypothetical protein